MADSHGTVVPTSRTRLEDGLQRTCPPPDPADNPGFIYTLSDGSKVRVMDADTHHPERAVFENKNGGPVNGFTGKQPVKPRNAPKKGWRSVARSLTHIH